MNVCSSVNNIVQTVVNNSLRLSDLGEFEPYTPLQVTVAAATVWATSVPAKKRLLTPESLPRKDSRSIYIQNK